MAAAHPAIKWGVRKGGTPYKHVYKHPQALAESCGGGCEGLLTPGKSPS